MVLQIQTRVQIARSCVTKQDAPSAYKCCSMGTCLAKLFCFCCAGATVLYLAAAGSSDGRVSSVELVSDQNLQGYPHLGLGIPSPPHNSITSLPPQILDSTEGRLDTGHPPNTATACKLLVRSTSNIKLSLPMIPAGMTSPTMHCVCLTSLYGLLCYTDVSA